MRISCVVLLGTILALATCAPQKQAYYGKYKIADKEFLQKQKDILRLYYHVNQPSYFKDYIEIAKTYSIEKNIEAYTNAKYVKDFLHYYRLGLVPKGEIFSVFYGEQLKQAIALFKLFYHAKDYDTFYKTAVWARNHVNEGLYVYALSVAIVHRDDTYGIVIPPIYEVYPYYFFNSEVIEKAKQYKQLFYGQQDQKISGSGYNGYTIIANYSGWYLDIEPEQSLSYFTEDIGINTYYWYYNLYYPFWLGGEEYKLKHDRRGEQFYYRYQQLLARYYLERLSNDYGEIQFFDWKKPIQTGYYPSLTYHNGLAFPERRAHYDLYYNQFPSVPSYTYHGPYAYSYYLVEEYERRIFDAIDSGYIKTTDGNKKDLYDAHGFDTLGNIIESNPDSLNTRYYGALQINARHYLGNAYQPLDKHKLAPSALQHFETSLRDPVFWQLYKRFAIYFQLYKSYLPKYTFNELNYPGVTIEDVEFDRLVTYFDYFYSDLSNAVYFNEQEYESHPFHIRARQYRLNHKPFTYKIHVNSDKAGQVVVRSFIGPKYDEYGRIIHLNDNRHNFVEFDKFVYSLPVGKHIIERNSRQNEYFPDRTSYKDLYDHVTAALIGQQEFHLDGTESYFGFPNRYLLPKGKHGGQSFQFYTIISPYHAPSSQQQQSGDYYYPKIGTGALFIDTYSLGYPFDRPIDKYNFYVQNSYFHDITIYHKDADEVNASQSHDNED